MCFEGLCQSCAAERQYRHEVLPWKPSTFDTEDL
jgi:uncharacterized protein YjaZ